MSKAGILLLLLVVGAAGMALILAQDREATAIASTAIESTPLALQSGTVLETPRDLPHFALLDHRSEPFTPASLAGHWTLVLPGFTHCPDICPTTLATLAAVHRQLGSSAERLQLVLLSVDPARDSPPVLARYVAYFDAAIVGVTGDQQQLDRLYQGLGINHIRIPGARGEYSVDHSAALLLLDPQGRLAGYFSPPFSAEALAADLAPLLTTSR